MKEKYFLFCLQYLHPVIFGNQTVMMLTTSEQKEKDGDTNTLEKERMGINFSTFFGYCLYKRTRVHDQ